MLTSRITSKGQTTIPKRVRDSLNISAGDVISFEVREGEAVLQKVTTIDPQWNRAVSATLTEWNDELDDQL
ncbi:MAG: AbrB/MazE/SpoVT family DNA-binding domain-containing protein [Alkalispirochaeta sp.]